MATLMETRSAPAEPIRRLPLPAPPETPDREAWGRYYEGLYRQAGRDASRLRWADLRPNRFLVEWLNTEAPGLIRPGATVAVVGCGLGDDAAELAGRGYDVLAFDVSPAAVEWARERHPHLGERVVVADLLELPSRMQRRFDLVVEVYTLQCLHPEARQQGVAGVCSLARPRGTVLVICRGRDDEPADAGGPPYPFTATELAVLMQTQGFAPLRPIERLVDDEESPPARRLRAAFRRV